MLNSVLVQVNSMIPLNKKFQEIIERIKYVSQYLIS
jgi:hypothetical protein